MPTATHRTQIRFLALLILIMTWALGAALVPRILMPHTGAAAPEQPGAPAVPGGVAEPAIELLSHLGGGAFALAVSPDGDYVYLGEGISLVVVDLSNKAQPQRVAQLLFEDEPMDVDLVGATLYIALGAQGLVTVDVSTPTSPTVLDAYDTPDSARGVHVVGSQAYVADWEGDLQIINAADPANLSFTGSCTLSGSARDVWVSGSHAYVLTNWTDGWLRVVDVQAPSNPSEVGSGYDLPGDAVHIWISGTTAYVADGWESGLQIIGLATPTAPTLLATYPSDNGTQDVCVVGSTAYVADREGGLVILDVSTPGNPSSLTTLDTGGEAYAVRVAGDHAYVAHGNGGLAAVSVITPASPILAGNYRPTGNAIDVFVGDVTSTAVQGSPGRSGSHSAVRAYLADAETLWVLNLTDPANPIPLGTADLRDWPIHLSVSDGLAFIAESRIWNGVEIVDVSDAQAPLVVGEYEPMVGPGALTYVNDVHSIEGYAYVATASGTGWPPTDGALIVVDASDPTSPDEVISHPTAGDARRVFVADDVAYVGDGPAGLQLIDVSTPASPRDLGNLPPPTVSHATEAVCVVGDRAYVTHVSGAWPSYESTFQIVDVSNGSAPVVLDSYTVDGRIRDIDVRGEDAFVAVENQGVAWLNVGGSQITLTATYNTRNGVALSAFQLPSAQTLSQFPFLGILLAMQSAGAETLKTSSQPQDPTVTPPPSSTPEPTGTSTSTPSASPTPTETPYASWAKTANKHNAAPGEQIDYKVILTWWSPDGQPGASTMDDTVPKYTKIIKAWSSPGGVTTIGRGVKWSGSIPSGGTATINYNVKVDCTELMKVPNSLWPEQLSNRASGHVGTFGYTIGRDVALFKPDLLITGMEATQSLQNLDNTVRLIKDKRTVVRVYIKAEYLPGYEGCDVPEVTAWLYGGPGEPLEPVNGPITAKAKPDVRPSKSEREKVGESLNFELPGSWVNSVGSLTLRAVVNPQCDRPDVDCENNEETAEVQLVAEPPLDLAMVRLKWQAWPFGTVHQAHWTSGILIKQKVEAMFPVPKVSARWLDLTYPDPTFTSDPGVFSYLAINNWLAKQQAFDVLLGRAPFFSRYLAYMGDADGGAAHPLSRVATAGTKYVDGLWVSTHELGHTYGLWHVCSNQDEPFCGNYAYEGGRFSPTTGPSQGTTNYGYDVSEPKAKLKIKKPEWPEMMTYAAIYDGSRWLSDFSWDKIRSKHPASIPTTPHAAAGPSEDRYTYLLVSGVVTLTEDSAYLAPAHIVADAVMQPLPSPGDYAVILYDGDTLVASYPFNAQADIHVGEEEGELAPFTEVVPWEEGTDRIEITRGETVLVSRARSTNAPTVTLTYPEGGELLTEKASITWLSGDADGDELEYAVLYSTDDGSTWQALTSGWKEESFELDAEWLPGSDQARVRVLATDGFNTSASTSPVFEVARKAPLPLIIMPEDGGVYPPGSLELQGAVLDLEDAEVTRSDLVWTDSISGTLGSGEVLHVSDLSPGWHTVTLAATDGDGMTGTHSVTFLIGNYVWLPMVALGTP